MASHYNRVGQSRAPHRPNGDSALSGRCLSFDAAFLASNPTLAFHGSAKSGASYPVYRTMTASPILSPTPLRLARTWSGPGRSTYLKLECELPTGSFKVRGAVYALTRRRKAANVPEVVAASTGNHGAAV